MDMNNKIIGEKITFDDVLLLPQYSDVLPNEVELNTRFSKNIELHIPIVAAAMDTVTEARLAIALAQEGGIGVIHKNMSIENQVAEVYKVKRAANGIIIDPMTLTPETKIKEAVEIMRTHDISGFPIVEGDGTLVGILTSRDLPFELDRERPVSSIMTKKDLVVEQEGVSLEKARDVMLMHKVEKLLVVDEGFKLKGLITIKDIRNNERYPLACKDGQGRLQVAAAIGNKADEDIERAEGLINAGVDALVVDSAHAHQRNNIEQVKRLRAKFGDKIDIIAGNIVTADAAKDLIEAGVDGLKVGIGPGSICTTRVVAGVGVPQISAIMEVVEYADEHNIPVIADGGIRYSGDIAKALSVGASSVMLGSLLAGVEESPGEKVTLQGRAFKTYRGMGSLGAMSKGSSDRYFQKDDSNNEKLVPEGIEGRTAYKGLLSKFVYQLVGGIRSAMGYVGAKDLNVLREKAKLIKVTAAGVKESHPHDIIITKEAPNYWVE